MSRHVEQIRALRVACRLMRMERDEYKKDRNDLRMVIGGLNARIKELEEKK